ncbi:MAG: ABC transporter permease [SAR324 cluster bacterium]|nr:ABC transporter permease [SAR324 cluster bacterium]
METSFAWLEIFLNASFWVASVRIATPLIFGTLGEVICERAGVLNLGIEGIMTLGAMAVWMAVYQGAGLWSGLFFAAACGGIIGLLHAMLTVPLGLSQHVTGIGVTLLATSLTSYVYRLILPEVNSPPRIQAFEPLEIPGLSSIPLIGEALFYQSPLTYFAFISVVVVSYVLYRTPVGLAMQMVGENPAAAEAQGVDVTLIRTVAVVCGSAFMAVGGAFLTMSAFNAFFFNMINGRGWICIALVVFASWRPGKALLGAFLFAAFDAYQMRLQQLVGTEIPYQIFLMMPYVLSILALIVMSRRVGYPQALMIPYRKGER